MSKPSVNQLKSGAGLHRSWPLQASGQPFVHEWKVQQSDAAHWRNAVGAHCFVDIVGLRGGAFDAAADKGQRGAQAMKSSTFLIANSPHGVAGP